MLPYKIANKLYKSNFGLYLDLYILYKKINERKEINLIKNVVKPGMQVIDIGANVGFYSLLLSDLVGNRGKVHCFEPEKKNFRNLTKTCKGRKNIILNNMAVGKDNRNINLYISDDLNVDHLTYATNNMRKEINIKCTSIDNYFKKEKKIDFIKIDTQGFEYHVIQGMKNTLERSKRIILLSEFSKYDLGQAGSSHKDYLKYLRALGMKVRYLEKDYKKRLGGKNLGRMSYVNMIASKGYENTSVIKFFKCKPKHF